MSRTYSFDYNNAYDPPAPFMPITVDGLDPTKVSVTVSAFVDSGADGTMLPLDILQAVGAVYEDRVWLSGNDGRATAVGTAIQYPFTSKPKPLMRSLPFAMPAGSEPLIGRDVLNQLVVTLHGIAGVTELQLSP